MEKKYIRSDNVSVSLSDSGAGLYDPDSLKAKQINHTGLYIWNTLNGENSIKDIKEKIFKEYDSVPEKDLDNDIVNILEELEHNGFIKEAGVGETAEDREYPHLGDGPGSVDISLTGKCNLHCEYCFYANEMFNRPDLSANEWFAFFDELGGLGTRELTLSGGEVFIRKNLWEIIDNIIKNRMRYSILSNGTLITDDTLKQFEKGKRRARLDYIQISIDGSSAEVHDKSRGTGSFDKAVKGLRLLRDAGFPVAVRITINKYNVDDLENTAEFLLEDIGLPTFSTNDAMPMGSGCDNQAGITLSPEQQLKAILKMHDLDQKYPGRISASAGPLAKWRTYGEMEHAKATGERSERFEMGYLTACGCFYNKISVHHDGIISPCNMLTDMEMGRINRNSIKDIWKGHKALKELKDRRKIPMRDVPDCKDCEWTEFCNGSCPGLPYTITGSLNRANMFDCYRNFLKETGLRSPDVPWYKK